MPSELFFSYVILINTNPTPFVTIAVQSQEEYDEDVVKIEELFTPLVLKCKENGRAMRIGTNHGGWVNAMQTSLLHCITTVPIRFHSLPFSNSYSE